MNLYTQTTNDIKVDVQPVYIEAKSSVIGHRHVFVYYINVHNQSNETVTLRRRYWKIYDDYGETHQVEGEGVIGRQPAIKPGKTFSYNSFSVLKSLRGSMEGYYEMEKENGDTLKVHIPKFSLVSHLLN